MPDAEAFGDYPTWLGQDDMWPSEDGTTSTIWNMSPQHAISCYRKLMRWADFVSNTTMTAHAVMRTPMAMALLTQAVGAEVLYADDLPEAPPPASLTDVDLEAVYDALTELDAHTAAAGKPLHPITRARVVHASLTRKETT